MLLRLAALFILVPLAELALLVYIGMLIGVLYTIIIVAATGLLGAILARHQGLVTLSRIRSSLEHGIVPSYELLNGVLILIGGLLLLTPGLITDAVGFTLLIPQTRHIIGKWLARLIQRAIQKREIHYWEVR